MEKLTRYKIYSDNGDLKYPEIGEYEGDCFLRSIDDDSLIDSLGIDPRCAKVVNGDGDESCLWILVKVLDDDLVGYFFIKD
jgi:hypothetical protein